MSVTINYSVSSSPVSSPSSLTNLLVSSPASTFRFGPLPASPSPATQQRARGTEVAVSRQHEVTASTPSLPLGHVDTADSAGTRGEAAMAHFQQTEKWHR